MVQKDCFVSLKQKPILYSSNNCFLNLGLLVLCGDCFVNIFLSGGTLNGERGTFVLHHRFTLVCHLNLLDDLFVLKIDLIHLCRHLKFIL